jgi:hypothetical protein
MNRYAASVVLVSAIIVARPAVPHAQGMLLNFAPDRSIQKYQRSTCEQLKQSPAEGVAETEDSPGVPTQRRSGPGSLHRQDRPGRCQQDVRARHVPVSAGCENAQASLLSEALRQYRWK